MQNLFPSRSISLNIYKVKLSEIEIDIIVSVKCESRKKLHCIPLALNELPVFGRMPLRKSLVSFYSRAHTHASHFTAIKSWRTKK